MEDHDSPSMSAVPSAPREAAPLSLAERCRTLALDLEGIQFAVQASIPGVHESLEGAIANVEAIADALDRVAGEMREEASWYESNEAMQAANLRSYADTLARCGAGGAE